MRLKTLSITRARTADLESNIPTTLGLDKIRIHASHQNHYASKHQKPPLWSNGYMDAEHTTASVAERVFDREREVAGGCGRSREVAGSIAGSGQRKVRGVFIQGEIPRFLTGKASIKI